MTLGNHADNNGSSNRRTRTRNRDIRRNKATMITISLRRQKVAELLQTSNKTNEEIAKILQVDPSTVSNDIRALKDQAVQFLYDLCKSDLCFFYRQTILDIDHARHECWKLYNNDTNNKKVTTKDRIQALRTIIQADIARFQLLERGEAMLSVKALNDKIEDLKAGMNSNNTNNINTSSQIQEQSVYNHQTDKREPVV